MSEDIKEILEESIYCNYDLHTQEKKKLLDYITNLEEKNERLNNIINEFDKFLFKELQTYGGGGTVQEYYDKLQELKGSDNNDYNEK